MTRLVRPVAAAAALATGLVAGAAPAGAQGVAAVGWWSSAIVDGAPVGVATLVPDGGLQVATGANGPLSIGAVRFAVPAGGTAQLTLLLANGSTPQTAAIAACPMVTAWTSNDGDPLSAAPTWDCTLGTTSGAYDTGSSSISFGFDPSFVRNGVVDVMLLPTAGANPYTLTFDPPGGDAVRVTAPTAGDQPAAATPATATSTPVAPAPGQAAPPTTTTGTGRRSPRTTTPPPTYRSVGDAASVAAATPPADGPDAPVAAAALAPAVVPPGLPAALPPASAAAPVVATRRASPFGRAVGVLLLLAAGAAAVALAVRQASLEPDDQERGVGRFARARDTGPPPI